MWGIGKKRSKLGKWLDRNGYSQEDLVNASGASRNTISRSCSDPDYMPSPKIMKKILKACRKIDSDITAEDFWDL